MEDGRGDRRRFVVEDDPPSTVDRRTFVKVGALAAAAAWLTAFGGSILRSLTSRAGPGEDASRNVFTYHVPEGERTWYSDMDGRDVMADDFPLGETAKVFVRGQKAILLHLDEAKLMDKLGSEGGFVAFSSTCTHLGCQVYHVRGSTPVGEFPDGIIYCPCHQGAFDPYRGAKVLYGPPPQPLPRIPLRIVDGRLEAA